MKVQGLGLECLVTSEFQWSGNCFIHLLATLRYVCTYDPAIRAIVGPNPFDAARLW